MTTSADRSDVSFLLWLIMLLWFLIDPDGRGLVYQSIIIDISWFEMAFFDCSEFSDLEEIVGTLNGCSDQQSQAMTVWMLTVGMIFVIFVALKKNPTKSDSERLSSTLENEMNDVASHLIELDKRLNSLEKEGGAEYQIDEWKQEIIEEDTDFAIFPDE